MNNLCNLCWEHFDGVSYDPRNIKTANTNAYLISIIENICETADLERIICICNSCRALILEYEVLKQRIMEIHNLMRKFTEKRHKTIRYLEKHKNENNFVHNDEQKVQELSRDHPTPIIDTLFEEIVDNSQSENDFINDSSYNIPETQITVHSDEYKRKVMKKKNYKCHCSEVFCDKKQFQKHILSHTKEKSYVCDICGLSYKQKNNFDMHMKMHNGLNPFTCVYCNKSFTQKIALLRHVPMHTGEKPHQCEECGKRFIHHTSFSIHKLMHSGEKPYKCPNCDKQFRSSSHLVRHKKIHTGEKKYGCHICGKYFAEKYNLTAHQRVHTNDRLDHPKTKLEEYKVENHFSS